MKISSYGIIAVCLVVIAVALAGCAVNKTVSATSSFGTNPTSTGTTGSSSSSGQASSASATAATCPTVNGNGAWDGKWSGFFSGGTCADLRGHFNPPDAKQQDYWGGYSSDGTNGAMDVTFTQNGCDVTGKASINTGIASTQPCQITYTGTASGTELKGTWKAYCNIGFKGAPEGGLDSGIFDIYMEPGTENTFIGKIACDSDSCRKAIANECPTASSNWVGKISSRSNQAASGTTTGSASSGGLTGSSTSGNSGTTAGSASTGTSGTSGSATATGSSVSASAVFGGASYNWVEYKISAVDANPTGKKVQSNMDMFIKYTKDGKCTLRYSNPIQGMPASMDCSSGGVSQGDPNAVSSVPSGTTFTNNGPDVVTVPAGTFTATKYTTTTQDGSTETAWVATGGPVVKITGSSSAGSVTMELNAQG